MDIVKANGISIYLHSGFAPIEVKNIDLGLKGSNPDMRGSFKIVDCRTLTAEGREGCRVISLDCSPDFLEYLASKKKNHKFNFIYSYLYINEEKEVTVYQSITPPH